METHEVEVQEFPIHCQAKQVTDVYLILGNWEKIATAINYETMGMISTITNGRLDWCGYTQENNSHPRLKKWFTCTNF